MLRIYKYLLRPTPEQEGRLDFLLWQARMIYNAALEQRITTYKDTGKSISYQAQWSHFRDLRKNQPDTLGQLNASALQHTLRRLDKSFSAFFRRIRSGEKPGFPRLQEPPTLSQHRVHLRRRMQTAGPRPWTPFVLHPECRRLAFVFPPCFTGSGRHQACGHQAR